MSKKDFATALNIAYGTVRSKISRRQMCCNKSGYIDTENSKNYSYLLELNGGDQSIFEPFDTKLNSKVAKKASVSVKNVVEKPKKEVFEKVNDSKGLVNLLHGQNTQKTDENKPPKETAEERKIKAEQKKHNEALLEFDRRKKEAEVRLVERKAELAQWELEKKAGNTLPLDMIEKVVGINYKAVFKSIHSQTKNIAMVMVQQLGGSKDDLNSIMIELENIFDKTVKDAEKKSSVDIEKLIDEYSEVRSRGERKV